MIDDSAVLDYMVTVAPCEIQAVGPLFGRSGYGFGLQKNSPYTDRFSEFILQLREQGFMDYLQNKWFVPSTVFTVHATCSGWRAQGTF